VFNKLLCSVLRGFVIPLIVIACPAPVAAGAIADQDPPDDPEAKRVVLLCGRLLAVPGEPPLENAVVVVVGERIQRVVVEPDAWERLVERIDGESVIDLRDRFVMPGLIDCHTHITSEYSRDRALRNVQETDADAAIDGVVYARRTLRAGFTTIRNVGSRGDAAFALRDAIDAGKVAGPRILVAGESISPTGGHSDSTHNYRDDLWDLPGAMEGIADGVAECRKAVRAQVKRGADVIKLTATGGVLSATAAGTDRQFFMDELRAIIDTAHLLGRKVAAHAHGADGIKAALRAGVDSIEHGTFVDDESIALFRETGAYLVPTILAGVTVAEKAEEPGYYPPMVADKAARVGPMIQDAFARAYEGGVRIAFGTDSGVSPHGENAREFLLMVEAGMPPMEAIKSATVNAADLCGLSDDLGTIESGKLADLIAVDGDPLQDIAQMQRVVFVMKAGQAFKD